jgi:hypothetical protein
MLFIHAAGLLKRLGSSASFNYLLSLEAKVISPRRLYLFDLAKHTLGLLLSNGYIYTSRQYWIPVSACEHATSAPILENGTMFRPLQNYTAIKLLYNSMLHAEIRKTSIIKQSVLKLKYSIIILQSHIHHL